MESVWQHITHLDHVAPSHPFGKCTFRCMRLGKPVLCDLPSLHVISRGILCPILTSFHPQVLPCLTLVCVD